MNVFLKRVKKIQLKIAYKIENWYAARQGKAAGEAETDASFRNQAWHEEVDRARQCQRDAEGKLFSLEVTEVQKMRVEMASMKRDVEHYSRQVIFSILQEHMELRKSYRELTDLLDAWQSRNGGYLFGKRSLAIQPLMNYKQGAFLLKNH
ncbi:hypothetical protein ACFX19_028666 [Malus domestica]